MNDFKTAHTALKHSAYDPCFGSGTKAYRASGGFKTIKTDESDEYHQSRDDKSSFT